VYESHGILPVTEVLEVTGAPYEGKIHGGFENLSHLSEGY